MNNYLMLGACFLLGIILHRSGRLPDNAAVTLNGFVVHISLPALTLAYVHDLDLNSRLILPALMPWIMFGLGCAARHTRRLDLFIRPRREFQNHHPEDHALRAF